MDTQWFSVDRDTPLHMLYANLHLYMYLCGWDARLKSEIGTQ